MDVQHPQDYAGVRTIYLARDSEPLEKVRISRLNLSQEKRAILKLVGINDRGAAEALVGSQVFFPIERLPKLAEGEVFYFEILGFNVEDTQHGVIGTLRDIFETGADDLLVVDTPDGQEVLIPFQEPVYLRTDKEQETIHVDLPEGLLELYTGQDS